MSDKELLYIQDVLNHAKHINELCDYCTSNVSDQSLQGFIRAIKADYQKTYDSVYGLLGG